MDQTRFDHFTRSLAVARSRRQVLKGLFAGGAVGAGLATGFTIGVQPASAQQCTPDDGACSADTECCSGSCDDSGYCYTPADTCIEDGGLCQAGRYCCSGLDCAPGGHCPAAQCIADGDLCQAGVYCCSGLDCAPGGHCPNSSVSTLPATGAGPGSTSDSTSSLITPVAAIAAAAVVVGARRLRADEQHDINA